MAKGTSIHVPPSLESNFEALHKYTGLFYCCLVLMKSVGMFCNVRSFCTESSVGPIAAGDLCLFLFKWSHFTGFQGTELRIFSESPQNSGLKGPDKGFCKHSTLFDICVKLVFANTHISNTSASELYCAINQHNTIYLVTVVRTANMLTPSPNFPFSL